MPYPHYKNSKASMNNEEPIYLNLFEVSLILPTSVAANPIMMEGLIKVGGLETDVVPPTVTQIYKGAQRRYAGSLPEKTTVDITLDFEVNLNSNNSMYNYKSLKQWADLTWDPQTGESQLKKDYIGGPLLISLHNKKGQIFKQWKFPTCFPISAPSVFELSYENGTDIYKITGFTLAADYWNDTTI